MTSKIILMIIGMQWFEISGTPIFQGLSFHRGFEINFKPLPKEPFVFIKEKWSPFGVFGKKFKIEKRSLDDIVPVTPNPVQRPVAPVFEHIDEIEQIGTGPLLIVPKAPLVYPSKRPPPIPHHVLIAQPSGAPLPIAMPIIVSDYPPIPSKPQIVPPISTNMVIIQPTKVVNNHVLPATGFYTDVSHVTSVKDHINIVKPEHSTGDQAVPIESSPPEPSVPLVPEPGVSVTPIAVSAEIIPPIAEPIPHPVEVVPPHVESIPPPMESIPPHVEPIPPPVESNPIPVESSPSPIELVTHPAVPVLVPAEPIPSPPNSEVVISPPPPKPIGPPIPPETPEPLPPKPIEEDKKEIPPPVSAEAPKKEIQLKDSTFIKGSKMALQFGTVFLTLMAQFLDSARASIDIMTNPPPQFKN